MAYTGYHFFIGDLEMPYAPSELTVTIGSNNETVNLISGNGINLLKSPKLTEIKFDVELPRGRQYAFANKLISSKTYTDYFENLMVKKSPTQLVITRPNPSISNGIGGTSSDFESNVLTVSLEGYELKESAENAFDVKVSLKFKEYLDYGVVIKKKTPVPTVEKKKTTASSYKVKKGDTLWGIARKHYGDATKWKHIYKENKTIIEYTAKRYGRHSSGQGHWIYPDTVLKIPVL